MAERWINHLSQPVGEPLPGWSPPPFPERKTISGRYCLLAPLDIARHADALYEANSHDREGRMWTYLAYGPFADSSDYRKWLAENCLGNDPLYFAILDREGEQDQERPLGLASYLRIMPAAGSIEVGHLQFSPLLQRRRAATEAMFLMMQTAFESGYRRYEWKCDALNAASRAAALRLGFRFEGLLRQASVYKGRSRDTAWFGIIDREWPALRSAFHQWLDPANFDSLGRQKTRLSCLTRAAVGELAATDG